MNWRETRAHLMQIEADRATVLHPLLRSIAILDVIMLAIAFVFFSGSIAYVYACDRL